jgi:hypothetical protein
MVEAHPSHLFHCTTRNPRAFAMCLSRDSWVTQATRWGHRHLAVGGLRVRFALIYLYGLRVGEVALLGHRGIGVGKYLIGRGRRRR